MASAVLATAAPSATTTTTTVDLKPRSQAKVRKRASKACLSCRARKVRCDVSQRGRPCMNCYLDSETCVVTGRASRYRRPREVGEDVQASYPPYPPTSNADSRSAEDVVKSRLDEAPGYDSQELNDAQATQTEAGSQITASQKNNVTEPEIRVATNTQSGLDVHAQQPVLPSSVPARHSMLPPPTSCGAEESVDVIYSYYPFLIMGNLSNIPPQDVNFLETQGCLRVPTRPVLDEFLQQYFLHVHPMLPLINEGDFWDFYSQNPGYSNPNDRLSLLLLQAILFASCTFVSKSTIKALGFSNFRAARASFYRRGKLLYDLDSETSPLAMAQASLLLSMWAPSSTKKPNTTWLNLAIQHAKTAEAHHYAAMPVFSSRTHPLQHRKQSVLKRLWWCCVIRDRTLGLMMRRPIQITRAHFDFEASPMLSYQDLTDEFQRSTVYDYNTKRSLAEILIQLIQLYVILTDILMLVFPLDDTPGWGRDMKPEDVDRIRECKTTLRRWYKDAMLRFPMFGGGQAPSLGLNSANTETRPDSAILYTNLMYMYYHSTRVVLCHHEVLHLAIVQAVPPKDGNITRDLSIIYENRHELQDAASGVTECLKELVQLKLARWLPISAVACTALPLVLNILDVKLSARAKESTMDQHSASTLKQHRLNILIEAMKAYQPQYDGVDWVSEIVRHIVNLAQIDSSPNTQSPGQQPGITDWTDILASHPSSYLRLALALDISLSKGRLPEDGDFPVSLRGLFTGGFSPLKSLVEANRVVVQDPSLSGSNGLNNAEIEGSGIVRRMRQESMSQHSTCSPTDSHMTNSDEAANEMLREQVYSRTRSNDVVDTNIPPSEGIWDLGRDVNGVLDMDESPSSTSYEGLYIDGPIPDISAEWLENLWDEMGDMEDKTDRDTARVLLEALKEGEA